MTLAEVFLLLMFVAWYGVAAATSEPGIVRELQLTVERLTKDLKVAREATAKAQKLEETNRYLREILDAVGRYIGAPVPTSVGEIKKWLEEHDKSVAQAAKRGSPPCSMTNNIVGVARVKTGDVELQLSQAFPQFGQGLEADAILRADQLRSFFGNVLAFYDRQKQRGNDCRFDYRLEWVTDADYRSGREQFEQPYFYPAGIRRVSASD
jgi:hypothetical protein